MTKQPLRYVLQKQILTLLKGSVKPEQNLRRVVYLHSLYKKRVKAAGVELLAPLK